MERFVATLVGLLLLVAFTVFAVVLLPVGANSPDASGFPPADMADGKGESATGLDPLETGASNTTSANDSPTYIDPMSGRILVAGKVTDGYLKGGVKDLRVKICDAEGNDAAGAFTQAGGIFKVELHPGEYFITLLHTERTKGYLLPSEPRAFSVPSPESTAGTTEGSTSQSALNGSVELSALEFDIRKDQYNPVFLDGFLRDSYTREPLAGAKVIVKGETDEGGPVDESAYTGPDGKVKIVLEAGDYTYSAQLEGYYPLLEHKFVIRRHKGAGFRLSMTRYTSVTGTVRDARTGNPIQGATVIIGGSAKSDENGSYTLRTAPGRETALCMVETSVRTYAVNERIVTIPPDGIEIDFLLEPLDCIIRVAARDAISGVLYKNSLTEKEFSACCWRVGSGTAERTRTHPEIDNLVGVGNYTIIYDSSPANGFVRWRLNPGKYIVAAWRDGYRKTYSEVFEVNYDDSIELVLEIYPASEERLVSVSGRLINAETGESVDSGAVQRVTLSRTFPDPDNPGEYTLGPAWEGAAATLMPGGSFSAEVLPGFYMISVVPLKDRRGLSELTGFREVVEVSAVGITELRIPLLPIPERRTVAVRCIEAESKKVAKGARILCRWRDAVVFECVVPRGDSCLLKLPPGDVTIYVWSDTASAEPKVIHVAPNAEPRLADDRKPIPDCILELRPAE